MDTARLSEIIPAPGSFSALKINLHTHTTFCDGKNTPEENVQSAIKKGMNILGFSSHSTFPHPFGDSIKADKFNEYRTEILSLKKKYEGQIKIKYGFEADYIENVCKPDFASYSEFAPEYLIGSVHYLNNGENSPEQMLPVDWSAQKLADGVKTLYGGSTRKLIQHYFETERKMLRECSFSIIGHPDLIRKFNEKTPFFDETEAWYKDELKLTAKEIARAGVIAEINTGAISRGYTTTPYPSLYFLELLHEHNVPVMLSSDSHSAEHLDCAFELALENAKKAGYRELAFPENNKIVMYKI